MSMHRYSIWIRLAMPLAAGLGLSLLFLSGVSDPPARAGAPCDRYVLGIDTSNTTDCSDPAHPCRTIQYAIDQAGDGDRICVAKHTLAGPLVYAETLVITKSVALDGAYDGMCVGPTRLTCSIQAVPCNPANVTVDAGGAGRAVYITGTIAPSIDCVTITGGNAEGLGGALSDNDAGGGVYSRFAAPVIVNSVITGNHGCDPCGSAYGRGGGVYLRDAPATAVISNNLIANNVADDGAWGQGGGVMLQDSSARVLSNTIRDNRAGLSAGYGGGIAVVSGTPVIADNTVSHNYGAEAGVQGVGGGIYVWSGAPVVVERNRVDHNLAIHGAGTLTSLGGGIAYLGDPTVVASIRDNTVSVNAASPISPAGYGGGVYVSGLISPSLVSGNTVEGNFGGFNRSGRGGGLYVDDSDLVIADNRFQDNSASWAGSQGAGGGICVASGEALIHSNVISGNHGGGFPGFPSTTVGYGGGVAILSGVSTVRDNWIVANNGTNAAGPAAGGGLYAFDAIVSISHNRITRNRASADDLGLGGGVYIERADPWLDANVIVDNRAASGAHGQGGGVCVFASHGFTLTNNIIGHNNATQSGEGVAIVASTHGQLVHNTIAGRGSGAAGGVHVDMSSPVSLINNIVADFATGIVNADPAGSTVGASHTLFEGNTTDFSVGVSSLLPVAGPALLTVEYRLGSGSGAIDRATPLAWVTRDVDREPRPMGPATDVGADEFWLRTLAPLVLRGY